MSGLAALILALSSLGWGALALRLTGVLDRLPWRERIAWSFGLGMGILGWLGFFAALAGVPNTPTFALIAAAGLPGLIWLRHTIFSTEPLTPWSWALLSLGAAILTGDLVEGLAPPTDADSLAYHFAIPRQILAKGHLVFVPRAADGAIPLLQQMTYLAALALGGEQTMTLWCGLSGWAAVLLTYAIGRRHLSRDWALAGALAMASLPAFLYGAGSGQVEARLAAFVTMAVIAILDSRRQGGLGLAALAGLAVGFSMASKYPGLLVAFLCGLAILAQQRGLAKAAVLTAVACVAGLQWYVWNWVNIGDPVFPMLYGVLPYPTDAPWNTLQNNAFTEWATEVESPLPRGMMDIMLYPLRVTFLPPATLDAGRTGLGVLPILLLPFAIAGAWKNRNHPIVRDWLVAASICLGFYLLWSIFGASQRVRHYLPFMPLVVIGGLAAANRTGSRYPLIVAVAATLLLQSAGQAVFARNFTQRLTSDESRNSFIGRNVAWAFTVTWANTHLPSTARIAINVREWQYLFNQDVMFITPIQQAQIEVRPDNRDIRVFWHQLRSHGVTHAIADPIRDINGPKQHDGFRWLVEQLVVTGCGRVIETVSGPDSIMSRTLGGLSNRTVNIPVIELTPIGCRLEQAPP